MSDLAVGQGGDGSGAEGTGADGTGSASAGGSGAVGAGGSVGAAGGSGGGLECTTLEDCGGERDCEIRSCDGGYCSIQDEPEGTACTDMGGAVCDGDGRCVECNVASDCVQASFVCTGHKCYPPSCANLVQEPQETDVDCGGPICPPCENGLACSSYEDCDSKFCSNPAGSGGGGAGGAGGVGGAPAELQCTPCSSDLDCPLTPMMDCNNERCR